MEVTRDKYELPVAIADTATELSIITNTSMNTICSSACHAKRRGGRSRFIKVILEEDGEEW